MDEAERLILAALMTSDSDVRVDQAAQVARTLREAGLLVRPLPPISKSCLGFYGDHRQIIMDADTMRSWLGEGFHTAFRKATDCNQAHLVWQMIHDMPAADWSAVIDFMLYPLKNWGFVYPAPEESEAADA